MRRPTDLQLTHRNRAHIKPLRFLFPCRRCANLSRFGPSLGFLQLILSQPFISYFLYLVSRNDYWGLFRNLVRLLFNLSSFLIYLNSKGATDSNGLIKNTWISKRLADPLRNTLRRGRLGMS